MPVYNRRFTSPDTKDPSPDHLQRVGPRTEVEIHLPKALTEALEREGKDIPVGIRGYALVDTGASVMCVDRNVLNRLGVEPVGRATVGTAGGPQEQLIFPARLIFGSPDLPDLDIFCLGGDFTGQGDTIALIGRDILMHFVFIYNGRLGIITLAH